jgi:hypothetical protein
VSAVLDDLQRASYGASSSGEVLPPSAPPENPARANLDLGVLRSDGSKPSPLLPGLPHTPTENCRALLCAVIWQAIMDRDYAWICTPMFDLYCSLIGWDAGLTMHVRARAIQGLVAMPHGTPLWFAKRDSPIPDNAHRLNLPARR